MALGLHEQISTAIQRSRHILIALPRDHRLDALASATALALVLRAQGKTLDVAADGYRGRIYDFLPDVSVLPTLEGLQQFTIKVNLRQTHLEQFSYDVQDGTLSVYCTTRGGMLKPEDVRATEGEARYDLVITVGAPDLPSLGKIFSDHRAFFERTTIINIDHSPANEFYGQINGVDLTAGAVAEVVHDLLPALASSTAPAPPLDKGVATALLAGVISATRSFRSGHVTPKTLRIASALVAAGANREAIIRSLYQSHSLESLKLWGRTLTRLRSDLGGKLVWAPVPESDFLEAGATTADLPGLTEALLSTLPAAEVVVLLAQEGGDVAILLTSLRQLHALQLARPFAAEGDRRAARWRMRSKTLPDAEREVIDAARENIQELEKI